MLTRTLFRAKSDIGIFLVNGTISTSLLTLLSEMINLTIVRVMVSLKQMELEVIRTWFHWYFSYSTLVNLLQ